MSEQQKLIDIAFQLVGVATDPKHRKHFDKLGHEGRMAWVAEQFRENGFEKGPDQLAQLLG